MRKYIIVIAVLVVAGIGASFLLIPGENDIAVMQEKDDTVAAAAPINMDFQAEYDKGNRSEKVLVGLADLYMSDGRNALILPILEQDVVSNPDHIEVRKQMAKLYQAAGRDDDYLKEMETIAEKQPTEANLKLLSDMYNYTRMYDNQVATLKRLIEVSGGKNPDYYVDTATILMMQENKSGAADMLQQLRTAHPDYLSFKLVRLMVSNYVDIGDPQKGYDEAARWVQKQPNAPEIADLANIINYGGRPDLAIALIELNPQLVNTQGDLLTAYVNALLVGDKRDQAFETLKAAHASNVLPPEMYRPFIELALERKDMALAESIVGSLDNKYFKEDDAINLVELARANDNQTITTKLISKFETPDYIANKPVLAAIIALVRRDNDEDQKIATALKAELTRIQRLRLAQACARTEKTQCFNTLVAQFPKFADMNPRELDEVVMLYISINRGKDIYTQVETETKTRDSEIITQAMIKLAASMGKRDVVAGWLSQSGRNTSTGKLSELFFIANDRNHGAVAMDIAAVLYERDPNEKHRDYLVSGYLRAGEYAKALPLLRDVKGQSRELEDSYLTALTKLGKGSPEHRTELEQYVVPQLESASVDSERKLQLVFMLINTNNKKAALPFIDQYAKSEGGEWRKLYNQVHAVSVAPRRGGARAATVAAAPATPAVTPIADMPRDYRMALATDPKTSDETRRMLAFSLIDDGFKSDATVIFQQLAENKSPDSQEVKDLLFMWGPRLNTQQVAWLNHRATTAASTGDKVRWGEYISSYGDDFAFMNYVSANPAALTHPSLRKKYFNAVAQNASIESFDAGLADWMNATNDPEALKDYADVAKAYGYQDAAVRALKKIETLGSAKEPVLKDLGILTFSQGKYDESDRYLSGFLQEQQQQPNPEEEAYEAYFYKGELNRRNHKNVPLANQYYSEIVRLGPQLATNLPRQSIYYSSLFHLGHYEQAKQGFNGLLERYPNDKSLLADYMSVLAEYKFYNDALIVANKYDTKAKGYNAQAQLPASGQSSAAPAASAEPLSEPMIIRSPHVQNVETFEKGREIKINFNQPLPENYKLASINHEWVESTKVGYDSVLVEAKPGYNLHFTPVSEERVAIIPSNNPIRPAPQMTAREQQARQQDLRLQMLYARLEMETGKEQQALTRLTTLQQHYPQDPGLLGYSAIAENYSGNWPHALDLVEHAQQLNPYNEDIANLRKDIQRAHTQQFVKLDYDYRRIGDNDEHITGISGTAKVTNRFEVGMNAQNDEMQTANTRRAFDGKVGDYDYSRQRGEVFGAYYLNNGDRVQASVFANNDTAGAGVYYAFNNPLGRSEALAEYKRPYWDFVEAVAEQATRDRVGIKHVGNITPETTVSAEISANRYNIALDDDVATTALVRANVVQQIRAQNPYLGVGYGFDGEYVTNKKYRPLANGDKYSPFPANSREVHFLSGIISQPITDSTKANLVAGYAYDRLGDHGPQVEGNITQDLGDDVEAQVRARYGLETRDTKQNATTLGGHLKYKF